PSPAARPNSKSETDGKRQDVRKRPQTRSSGSMGNAHGPPANRKAGLPPTSQQRSLSRSAISSREDELIRIRNTDIDRYFRERNARGQAAADELMEIRRKEDR
ncbi:MAG: hypothetical protein ACREC6_03200, partial [Hyphomicrobiaceae bacterium]